jgi:hypothetical protein
VPSAELLSDPEFELLTKQPAANCWIGQGRHIMAYPINNRLNLVMAHPWIAPQDRWNQPGTTLISN